MKEKRKMAASMNQHAATTIGFNTSAMVLSLLKTKEGDATLSDPSVLETLVQSTCDLHPFSQDGSTFNEFVGFVNKSLGASSTRITGLALLGPILSQSSAQQFHQHSASWLRLLTQIIQPHSHISHLQLCTSLVNQLLSRASSYPDISREFSNKLIHPLVDKTLNLKDERLLLGLEFLKSCIKYFPGPCGPLRNNLVNHFTFVLGNSDSDSEAESAGNCYALLPSIGGGGVGGVLHQEAWSFYMNKLLHTAQGAFSKLYKDQSKAFEDEADQQNAIPLPVPTSDEPEQTIILAKQAQRILNTMRAMFENTFEVTVVVPHREIITLVCDVLAVTGRALMVNGSTQSYYLLMVLSGIHEAGLKLLNALISRCGRQLLPNGQTINQLLLQVLNWITLCDGNTETSTLKNVKFRNLKNQVYKTYHTWLDQVGVSSYMGENAAKLIAHVMNDAQLQEHQRSIQGSSLTEPSGGQNPGPRKKKQKKHHQWKVAPVGTSKPRRNSDTENLCISALRVLKQLFLTCGPRLKWTLHRDVHSAVTRVLLQCQTGLCLSPTAYQSALCRKELYHVLLASTLVPSPSWSVPLHSCINIFSQGRSDCSAKVKEFCTEASTICDNLIHPRVRQVPLPMVLPKETGEEASNDVMFLHFSINKEMNFDPMQKTESSPVSDEVEVVKEITTVERTHPSTVVTEDHVKEKDSQRTETLGHTKEFHKDGENGVSCEQDADDVMEQDEEEEEKEDEEKEDEEIEVEGISGNSNDKKSHDGESNTEESSLPVDENKMDLGENSSKEDAEKPTTTASTSQDGDRSVDDMLASFSTEGPDEED